MGSFSDFLISTSLLLALYLGFRTINLFNSPSGGYFNTINKITYWIIIFLGSFSFVASRFCHFIANNKYYLLAGNIFFALILCFFYGIVLIDIYLFIKQFFSKKKVNHKGLLIQVNFIVISFVFFAIGLYCASCARIVNYQVNVDKVAKVNTLKIVQISDIHLNETTSTFFIQHMVDQINELKPDYVFITGDTLDLAVEPYINKNLAAIFRQLKTNYGTFIIFGNHEHAGIERYRKNNLQDVKSAFEAGNMTVLLDDVFYDNRTGITIIGRQDQSISKYGKKRQNLSFLMKSVDPKTPIMLLDHQPSNLDEPAKLGVDIMFAGHTHGGQIFPMNLMVKAKYKNAWGIYQPKEYPHFTSIVTSGYGLWGPPIRLMTQAEIVVANVHFASQSNVTAKATQEKK